MVRNYKRVTIEKRSIIKQVVFHKVEEYHNFPQISPCSRIPLNRPEETKMATKLKTRNLNKVTNLKTEL